MALTVLDLIIYGVIGFILLLLILFLYFKWADIMSFLFPDKWNIVTILEADNNVSTWIQKKTKDLRFEFNDGFYNMYDTFNDTREVELPNPDGSVSKITTQGKKETSIYRNGRLAQFFYVEGNEEPLDFRNNIISSNPQMRKQMLSVDLTKLFTMGNTFKTWILYAIVGFLVGLIIGNIVGGYGKIPAPQTAQAIIGLWVVKNVRKS